MEIEEYPILEEGEVYVVTTKSNGNFYMIGRVTNNNTKTCVPSSAHGTARCEATYLSLNNYNEPAMLQSKTWAYYCENERLYRKATSSEIIWLDRCIDAGHYVTKPLSVSDFIFKNGVCSSSG